MKVAFYTLGCKVNTYESEVLMNKFKREGYEIVDFNDLADVYVINTCSVTNTSDQKSRKIIREASRMNKDAIICVMGCYSQLNYQYRAGQTACASLWTSCAFRRKTVKFSKVL